MDNLPEKLTQVRANYQKLRADSQNPHADPMLKSLELAISRLESQLQPNQH